MTTSDINSTSSTTSGFHSSDGYLDRIEQMAAMLMPVRDIALLMEMTREDTEAFCYAVKNGLDTPISMAYRRGRLQTKLALRSKVVDYALKGSPTAQPMADEYLKENDLA